MDFYSFPTQVELPGGSITITEPRKFRKYKAKPNYAIIGIKDPALVLSYAGTSATTLKQDFITYQDRAIIQIKNTTGSDVVLTGGSIRGKRIVKISGTGGFIWEYSDYDSIEKNGETFTEVNSDYIVNADQCKAVGDYTWKESQPHKVYTLSVQGLQYWLDIGDVYTLDLQYALSTGNIENISTDVEVVAINFVKSVGTLGTTEVVCRVPSAAWELTTTTPARLVGAGSSSRLENRSNVVTVGSSTWVGQADYFCDGTDDHVEIQAAIDYLEDIGGGTISFTAGQFNITTGLTVGDDIVMRGSGNASIIKTTSSINLITVSGSNSIIDNLYIDGVDSASYSAIVLSGDNNIVKNCIIENKVNITGSNNELTSNRIVPDASGSYIIGNILSKSKSTIIVASSTFEGDYQLKCDGTADQVQINQAIDYVYALGGGTVELTNGTYYTDGRIVVKDNVIFKGNKSIIVSGPINDYIINCSSTSYIKDIIIDGTGIDYDFPNPIYGLYSNGNAIAENITVQNINKSTNHDTVGFYNLLSTINCNFNTCSGEVLFGFYLVNSVANCKAVNNDTIGIFAAFNNCKTSVSSISSSNESDSGSVYSFYNTKLVSSCISENNTADYIISFYGSTYISSSSSTGNTASTYYGFYECTNITTSSSLTNTGSVTETGFHVCNSVQQCKSNDTTKYNLSYADAGTSYACADTPNGGFNS